MPDALPRIEDLADWAWRINNLYWIVDEDGKPVPFRLRWAQAQLIQEFHLCNVILKARQLGFTTFLQVLMLDACVFNSNIRCGTIAHTLPDAQIIFRDKVKYPYDQLPEGLKSRVYPIKDSETELLLSNNSSLRVGTSLRSGTLQYLHVSEYGKICARNPKKAIEIRTGALNTVKAGQRIFIESTAEGQDGHFFDLCQQSREHARRGRKLTALDFKFHFFPWWQDPKYAIADFESVEIPARLSAYFDKLERQHGIVLSAEQCAWYAAKERTQKGEMKREFPSTPDEAFEAAIEGAYYAELLSLADEEKRIGRFPWDPQYPVHLAFDLGIGDDTVIWFMQRIGAERRFIDYLDGEGKALPWYAKELDKKPYRYGKIILPHDGSKRSLNDGKSRQDVLEGLGFRNVVVNARRPIPDSIEAARNYIPLSTFDAERCEKGLKALRSFRKQWDDRLGRWLDEPLHDWASHAASGFAEMAVADPQDDGRAWKKLNYDTRGYV